MKIWIQPHGGVYTTVLPMDDEARQWMRAQCPIEHHQYSGDALVVPQQDVEKFENNFIDDGGNLI